MSILFHSLYTLKNHPGKSEIRNWIRKVISDHNRKPGMINIIYVSDAKLLEINTKYLNHTYYTDIITFNYNSEKIISGDIYISIERVKENAEKFTCLFELELLRVIIHGIFHLIGFNDSTKIQKKEMRELEDKALKIFPGTIKS